MISFVELQWPRFTPALREWDLAVILEYLRKPLYEVEPLQDRGLSETTPHLLEAMALAGRHSELQALVLDSNVIIMFYFSPAFMRKNKKTTLTNDPWYIPAVPTRKSEFGLQIVQFELLGTTIGIYMSDHPELRKDRHCLFIPIKYNNARKEHSAATISD